MKFQVSHNLISRRINCTIWTGFQTRAVWIDSSSAEFGRWAADKNAFVPHRMMQLTEDYNYNEEKLSLEIFESNSWETPPLINGAPLPLQCRNSSRTATTGSVFTISGFQTRRLSGKHRAQHFSSTRDTKWRCEMARWHKYYSVFRPVFPISLSFPFIRYHTTTIRIFILECSNYVPGETRQLCKYKLRPILRGSRYPYFYRRLFITRDESEERERERER